MFEVIPEEAAPLTVERSPYLNDDHTDGNKWITDQTTK
jgi:hypothetical protein